MWFDHRPDLARTKNEDASRGGDQGAHSRTHDPNNDRIGRFETTTIDTNNGIAGRADCKSGMAVTQACSSGEDYDCKVNGGAYNNVTGCHPLSYLLTTSTTERYSSGDGLNDFITTCPTEGGANSGYVVTSLCTSGKNKDCLVDGENSKARTRVECTKTVPDPWDVTPRWGKDILNGKPANNSHTLVSVWRSGPVNDDSNKEPGIASCPVGYVATGVCSAGKNAYDCRDKNMLPPETHHFVRLQCAKPRPRQDAFVTHMAAPSSATWVEE